MSQIYHLRAGPISAILDDMSLRDIQTAGTTVAERIYPAVRDEVWNTIPGTVANLRVNSGAHEFEVVFTAEHRHGPLAFSWLGTIQGSADGRITYGMKGVALAPFRYCRIGLNVHHGVGEYAGRSYRASLDDEMSRGQFPVLVGAQRLRNGKPSALIGPINRLDVELRNAEARFWFEGDEFEIEDQRNFGDASFKTYSTPLTRDWPFEARRFDTIYQSISLNADLTRHDTSGDADAGVQVSIGSPLGRLLPRVGFGVASDGVRLSTAETARVRPLRPSHLRIDVTPTDPGVSARLEQALDEASSLGARLELALHVQEDGAASLAPILSVLRTMPDAVEAVLVFTPSRGALDQGTPMSSIHEVRRQLAAVIPGPLVGGGSDVSFASINRGERLPGDLEILAFPISPTVHLADDVTIMANLAHLGDPVATARSWGSHRRISVSPITLATRFGPYPNGPAGLDALPAAVDSRQSSLLAAAWTVGAMSQLAIAGADTTTFFETVGWRGTTERDQGSSMPSRFVSTPGMYFPLWHVFEWLAEMRESQLLDSVSSDPRRVLALATSDERSVRVLVASLDAATLSVDVGALPGNEVQILSLDELRPGPRSPGGMAAPLATPQDLDDAGHLRLTMAPYSVLSIASLSSPNQPNSSDIAPIRRPPGIAR